MGETLHHEVVVTAPGRHHLERLNRASRALGPMFSLLEAGHPLRVMNRATPVIPVIDRLTTVDLEGILPTEAGVGRVEITDDPSTTLHPVITLPSIWVLAAARISTLNRVKITE